MTVPLCGMGGRARAAYLVSSYAEYINGEALTMDGGAWLGKGFLSVQ